MGEFSYDPFLPSALGPILIFGNDPWLNDLFPRDNEKMRKTSTAVRVKL